MKPDVELLYDLDCPNIGQARSVLLKAFDKTAIAPSWTEWERRGEQSPEYARLYGSPTILVNGQDVSGLAPGEEADCCRVYLDDNGGFRGAPSVNDMVAALERTKVAPQANGGGARDSFKWRGFFAALPGVGAAVLPVGACPACWLAYAGVLGAFGFGFLLDSTYLLPLTAAFLGTALLALAYRARARHGYGPFALGVLATAVVLVGKFAFASDLLLYMGLVLLIGASVWNGWPRKRTAPGSCPACAPQVTEVKQ